ncbi:MAG TPA: tetratricopeptide repeat protein, partial [Thermoanaerobaculia bacterium]|nr:tetratricopeptide repeat protein [Thermoanaerobaculia bacterium]
ALLAAGDPAAAETELARVAELVPEAPGLHHLRARAAQAAGRCPEAADHYARHLALAPADHAARYNRAVCLTLAGSLDEAVADFRRALAGEPGYRRPLAAMARALGEHPDPAVRRPDAAAALERLLAEPPPPGRCPAADDAGELAGPARYPPS